MTTKPRNTRPATRDEWNEQQPTRKGRPSHRAKHHTTTAREWKQYVRSL